MPPPSVAKSTNPPVPAAAEEQNQPAVKLPPAVRLAQAEDPDSSKAEAEDPTAAKLKKGELNYRDLSEAQKQNKTYALAALTKDPYAYTKFPPSFFEDASFMKDAVKERPDILEQAGRAIQDNREIVQLAARRGGDAFQYASDRLKKDPDFVRETVIEDDGNGFKQLHNDIIQHADISLRSDRAFVESMITGGAQPFRYASESLRFDRTLLEAAIEQGDGDAIAFTSEKLRGEKAIVLKAFDYLHAASTFTALPADLQNDREVALSAVRANSDTLHVLPEQFRYNREFVKDALKRSPSSYPRLTPEFAKDPELIRIAVIGDYSNATHIPESALKDQAAMQRLMREEGRAYKYLPDDAKNNSGLLLAAAKTQGQAILAADADWLKTQPGLIRSIATANVNSEAFLEEKLGALSPEVKTIFANGKKALQLLGFGEMNWTKTKHETEPSYGRFDDSKEIIRNRYAVADQKTQAKLEGLMGKEFFAGALSPDTRPTTLVIMAKEDKGQVLAQFENIFTRNNVIDQLTEKNRVVLYEAGDQDELVSAFKQATRGGKAPVDNLVIGGHGQSDAIMLGDIGDPSKFKYEESGGKLLDVYDEKLKGELAGMIKPNGIVSLLSCLTGKGKNATAGIDNIAEHLHSFWPNTTVFAPTESIVPTSLIDADTRKLSAPEYNRVFESVEGFRIDPIAPTQK